MHVVGSRPEGPNSAVIVIEGTHRELDSTEAVGLACEEATRRFQLARPGLGGRSGIFPVTKEGADVVKDGQPLEKNVRLLQEQPIHRCEFTVNGEP